MRDKLHAFLKAQGVKVVLQGHNHYYAHCEYDGVHYLTLGSGGCNLTDPATVAPLLPRLRREPEDGVQHLRPPRDIRTAVPSATTTRGSISGMTAAWR